jgi:hypothetical protein
MIRGGGGSPVTAGALVEAVTEVPSIKLEAMELMGFEASVLPPPAPSTGRCWLGPGPPAWAALVAPPEAVAAAEAADWCISIPQDLQPSGNESRRQD